MKKLILSKTPLTGREIADTSIFLQKYSEKTFTVLWRTLAYSYYCQEEIMDPTYISAHNSSTNTSLRQSIFYEQSLQQSSTMTSIFTLWHDKQAMADFSRIERVLSQPEIQRFIAGCVPHWGKSYNTLMYPVTSPVEAYSDFVRCMDEIRLHSMPLISRVAIIRNNHTAHMNIIDPSITWEDDINKTFVFSLSDVRNFVFNAGQALDLMRCFLSPHPTIMTGIENVHPMLKASAKAKFQAIRSQL